MLFMLHVYHRGRFKNESNPVYEGGEVAYFPEIDPDFMSIIEIRELLKHLTLQINMPIHYQSREGEFIRLYSDNDVMQMFGLYRDSPHIMLYVGKLVVAPDGCRNHQKIKTYSSTQKNL